MSTFAAFDLSNYTVPEGYIRSLELITDVLLEEGHPDVAAKVDHIRDGLWHTYRLIRSDEAVEELVEDFYMSCEDAVGEAEDLLWDVTDGRLIASAYEGSYIVADATWWDEEA